MRTHYDEVAPTYDQRYDRHAYAGIAGALLQFAGDPPRRVLEVGCGSAHWLALLIAEGHSATGIDASAGMLQQAAVKVPAASLMHGHAESLPFESDSFERVFIINALHHFSDARRALVEARRVLCADGALLIIGLDPASNQDSWCIYNFFPGTLQRDRQRFPATRAVRDWLLDSGFARCHTYIAEKIERDLPAREALASGELARHSTSQLSELSDSAYAEGLAAIVAAAEAAEAAGDTLRLRAHLHLFATVAQVNGAET